MRVVIYGPHHVVGAGRCMREAFLRIGVDVRTLGASAGALLWGKTFPDKYVWQGDGPAQHWWPDWRPDLIIIMCAETYHHAHYHDVPHIVYGVDNHERDYRQPGVTHYFLGHRNGPKMPVRGSDTTWLPCGYDPVWCTPSPIPFAQRKYDVAMIGFMYGIRKQALDYLKQQPFTTIAGVGEIYEQYRDIYHNARISLCLSLRNDVAMRIFETAAMGCAIVSDPCDDFTALGADGIVVARDIDEMIRSIRTLLADPAGAQAVIERSRRWALPHTWDARANFIRDWFTRTYGGGAAEPG